MALSIFQACEINDPEKLGIVYDGTNFVSFYGTSQATLSEKITTTSGSAEGVTNIVVRSLGSEAVTVEFDFDTTGIELTAVEDEDFVLLNSSKTLSFPAGGGEDTISIKAIDNQSFDGGTRKVAINLISKSSESYDWGNETTCILSVMDDDHPLSSILGNYSISADGVGTTNYDITLLPIEGDITKVYIENIIPTGYFSAKTVAVASVDLVTKTISMEQGQVIGTSSNDNYGKLVGFDGNSVYWPAKGDDAKFFIGTIADDFTNITFESKNNDNIGYGCYVFSPEDEALGWTGTLLLSPIVWTKK